MLFRSISVYWTQESLHRDTLDIVLYDQLSTVYSPIEFKDRILDQTIGLGDELVYYNTSEVTVSLLKHPPEARLVILRMHSGVFDEGIWLFSGEQYTPSKHVTEQIRGDVHMARCSSTSEVAFSAGAFLFLSASELIPEMHEEHDRKKALIQLVVLILGMATIYMLGVAFHHE